MQDCDLWNEPWWTPPLAPLSCPCPSCPIPEQTQSPSPPGPGEAAVCHLCAHRLSWLPWGCSSSGGFVNTWEELSEWSVTGPESLAGTEGSLLCTSSDRGSQSLQSRVGSVWRGQEQSWVIWSLSEVGDLKQAVAKGSARCFWHSGGRRGSTLVQSQLEMPSQSLLRLCCWVASWERAVQMLYWIFKEEFLIGTEIWERTECSKSLQTNRAPGLQVCEWQKRFI